MSGSKELLRILDSGQIRSWRSHKHAFRPLPFSLASVCGVCSRSTFGNFYTAVRCVSCGFVAHRSCAAPETPMEPCPSAPDLDGSDASQAPEELEDEDSDDLGVLAIAGGVGVGLASAIFGGAVAGPAGALMGINLGRYAGVGLAAAKVSMGAGGAVVGYRNARKVAETHKRWTLELEAKRQWDSITGVRAGLIALGKLQDVEIPAIWRETAKKLVHPEEPEKGAKPSLIDTKRYSSDSDWLVLDFNECTREEEVQLLILRAFQEKGSLLCSLHGALLELFRERHPTCAALNDRFLKQQDVREGDVQIQPSAFSAALDAYGFTHEVLAVVLLKIPGLRNCVETVVAAINGVDRYIFADIYGAVFEELSRHARADDEVLAERIATLKEVRMRILSGRREQERRYAEAVLVDTEESSAENVDDDFDFEHMLPDSDMQDWYHTGYSLDAKRFLSTRAIKLLKKMQVASTALDKLRTVVAALEAMSSMEIQVQAARQGGKPGDAVTLRPVGTDELLPSLCAHLVQAGVNDLHAQLSFIRAFCRDDYRTLGTEGYALSSLEAALQIIMLDAHYDEPGALPTG